MTVLFQHYQLTIMTVAAVAAVAAVCPQGSVFINELHHDMVDVDTGEYAKLGPAGFDLTGWKLEFYNGNNDSLYDQITLSGVLSDAGEGYGFTVAESSQIQMVMLTVLV